MIFSKNKFTQLENQFLFEDHKDFIENFYIQCKLTPQFFPTEDNKIQKLINKLSFHWNRIQVDFNLIDFQLFQKISLWGNPYEDYPYINKNAEYFIFGGYQNKTGPNIIICEVTKSFNKNVYSYFPLQPKQFKKIVK
jgi:hypothetical protein